MRAFLKDRKHLNHKKRRSFRSRFTCFYGLEKEPESWKFNIFNRYFIVLSWYQLYMIWASNLKLEVIKTKVQIIYWADITNDVKSSSRIFCIETISLFFSCSNAECNSAVYVFSVMCGKFVTNINALVFSPALIIAKNVTQRLTHGRKSSRLNGWCYV